MHATIHAVAPDGCPIDIDASTVLALSPDLGDAGRTRFFTNKATVSAAGSYEEWMDRFAGDWTARTR